MLVALSIECGKPAVLQPMQLVAMSLGRLFGQHILVVIWIQPFFVPLYMPGTELIIWSDMFDINHNAKPGSRYALSRAPFVNEPAKILATAESMVDSATGNKMLTRKPTIMCWGETAAETVKYFSNLGFPVLAATYYDKGLKDDTCTWLQSLQPYSQAQGMMYTTWHDDYAYLDGFAQTYGTNCSG